METNWNGKLIDAANSGKVDVLEECLANGADVNYQNNLGNTALMYAALNGHTHVARLFLTNYDYNRHLVNHDSYTPLMLAAWNGHLRMTKCLMQYDSYYNIRNINGKSALHIAAERGHLEVTKLLARRLGSLQKTYLGKTAYDLAITENRFENDMKKGDRIKIRKFLKDQMEEEIRKNQNHELE